MIKKEMSQRDSQPEGGSFFDPLEETPINICHFTENQHQLEDQSWDNIQSSKIQSAHESEIEGMWPAPISEVNEPIEPPSTRSTPEKFLNTYWINHRNFSFKHSYSLNIIVRLIENLNECLDESILNKLEIKKDVKEQIKRLRITLPEQSELQEQLNHIEKKFRCDFCLTRPVEVTSGCGNEFCRVCFSEIIRNATNGLYILSKSEIKNIRPKCPICHFQFNYSDLKKGAGELKAYYKLLSKERNKKKRCLQCKRNRRPSQFEFEEDYCQHICKDCLLHNLENNINNCPECNTNLKKIRDLFSHKSFICKGCNRSVNYMSFYVIRTCNEHYLCFDCLKFSIAQKECKVCDYKLKTRDIKRIKKSVFKVCLYCNNTVEIPYFISNNCCKNQSCVVCEFYTGRKDCLGCSKSLNCIALMKVDNVKAWLGILKQSFPELDSS